MLCAVTAAYACSRWRFRGRRPVLRALLVLNAFPQVLSLFAYYRILRLGGLLNSHAGLVLIYAGSMCVFGVWNMKGYFDTIPVEIEEASKIDGANDAQMIWKIVLPLAKPAIVVTCVMVLITVWNEYLFATTFLLDSSSTLLRVGSTSCNRTTTPVPGRFSQRRVSWPPFRCCLSSSKYKSTWSPA